MNAGSLSIVVPTHNRARLLGPTLESIKQLIVPKRLCVEVLVINNNCTDDTEAVVAACSADAPWPIRQIVETRQGLCFGRNRGLDEACGDHVVYFDDDIRVNRKWLAGYMDAVERHDADCVVGPVHPVFESPAPRHMTRRVINSIGSAYSRKGSVAHVLPEAQSREVPGCNFGVRLDVARAIGGFDPSLDRIGKGLLAGGDSEFGGRLGAHGHRIVYEPRCAIEHIITAEKLDPAYLRKRWFGVGRTQGILCRRAGQSIHPKAWRMVGRTLRLGAASLWHRLSWNSPLALQRELEARHCLGLLDAAWRRERKSAGANV